MDRGYKKIEWASNTTHQSSSEPNLSGTAPPLQMSLSAMQTSAALQRYQACPSPIAFHRPFRRLFRSSLLISCALCLLYAHCWSRSLSSFKASREVGATFVCRGVFGPLITFFPSFANTDESCSSKSCANESLIWLLWLGPILSHLFYFTMNEFGGKHEKGYKPPTCSHIQHSNKETTSSGSLDKEGIEDLYNDNMVDSFHDDEDEDTEWSLSSTIQKFAKPKLEQPKGVLPMVPWFHVMLIKSAFDLLVSLHIFLGRFDARKMQVALRNSNGRKRRSQDGVFDFTQSEHHLEPTQKVQSNAGFWFDFMSDCGDGFNSSYQVARCLAQPYLTVNTQLHSSPSKQFKRDLPRGKVLIIGGDLAYPDPTPESYECRFFRTFEDALPPPKEFRKQHISVHKPALPERICAVPVRRSSNREEEKKSPDIIYDSGNEEMRSYPGPCAFAIPGNHDWFDGLATYTRYILHRDWLGGWIMPQQTSYFALELPRGWWILGMDLALDNDINIEQFGFFADLAKQSIKADDNVIVVTHIPFWVLTNYEAYSVHPETNLTELLNTHLKGRVRLRLAGDLHHYTRHMPCSAAENSDRKTGFNQTNSNWPKHEPVLIVSGGGGAVSWVNNIFQLSLYLFVVDVSDVSS